MLLQGLRCYKKDIQESSLLNSIAVGYFYYIQGETENLTIDFSYFNQLYEACNSSWFVTVRVPIANLKTKYNEWFWS